MTRERTAGVRRPAARRTATTAAVVTALLAALGACTAEPDVASHAASAGTAVTAAGPRIVTDANIVALGDSLTEGVGPGAPYPTMLADLAPGADVVNLGHGGATAADVAVIFGAVTVAVTPAGGALPASGGVDVELASDPTVGSYHSTLHGTLAGVPGMLDLHLGTFTRDSPGVAVPLPGGAPFEPDAAPRFRDRIAIIWVGQNDLAFGWPYEVTAPRDAAAAMIATLGPTPRYVVVGVTTTNPDLIATVAAQNQALASTFGDHFLDMQAALGAPGEPLDRALTLDGVHFTAQTRAERITPAIAEKLVALGYGR